MAAVAVALLANAAQATEIYANNPAPGDAYTNAVGDSGQAIGSTGWYYNNVRNSTVVGISTANPRSGNASVSFVAPAQGKADVEFLPGAVANPNGNFSSNGSLGAFDGLSSMSYDWYRVGTSGAADHLHPSLRVMVDRDGDLGTNDRGYLIFERAYNGLTTPEDAWVTDTVNSGTFLWNSRFFSATGFAAETNINATHSAFDGTLAEWQAFMPQGIILGFSSGVGSGWGSFTGAVDNISWTIDGVTTLNNFEVAAAEVPEPASAAAYTRNRFQEPAFSGLFSSARRANLKLDCKSLCAIVCDLWSNRHARLFLGRSSMKCIVCGSETVAGLAKWHSACRQCGYEGTTLQGVINDTQGHDLVNEADRERGLKALRLENFKAVAALAARFASPGATRLLDVGCAHGWFLETARDRFEVLGIEPDGAVGSQAQARGLPVRHGYFPDALQPGEYFDVIVFNDVIEHIPDIGAAIAACCDRLNPDGILLLNLPSSSGFFYRLSKLFVRIGWQAPFARLWQEGLPSPHVHYFNARNLARLLAAHGLDVVYQAELPALRAHGLLERLRCVTNIGPVALYTQYLGILAAIPVLRLFASDIAVGVFRKR